MAIVFTSQTFSIKEGWWVWVVCMHVHLCGYIGRRVFIYTLKKFGCSHDSNKEYNLLGYNEVHFGESPMFQSKILPPSSESNSKLSQKSAQLDTTTCQFRACLTLQL
jgi:hypothetical protein